MGFPKGPRSPEAEERRKAAHREAMKRWHADPVNAAAFAKRMSERMKARHADPAWKERRSEISSRSAKKMWAERRGHFVQLAVDRYARMVAEGTGICSEDSVARKNAASKWIMQKAQDELHANTEFNELYRETQARLRRDNPYDETGNDADYFAYCSWLGTAVASDPVVRALADTFMSAAIPRWAKAWQERKHG